MNFGVSVMSATILTEVKRQWVYVSTGMGDGFSALRISLMGFVAGASRPNLFRLCYL